MSRIRLHLKKLKLFLIGCIQLYEDEGAKWAELTDAKKDRLG